MRLSTDIFYRQVGKTVLVAIIALTVTLFGGTASADSFGQIMPLGDSITAGKPDGGYRSPLCQKLINGGHTFQFVGSGIFYADSILTNAGQTHHEGHPAYRILGNEDKPGLSENLVNWIGPGKASPDIILLMIGTNEMHDGTPAVASQHLDDLIGGIYGYLPDVNLYVASLTVRLNFQESALAFNATVPGIVADYEALGKNIHFVDMYPVLAAGDLADNVHPDAGGYAKMADAWLSALEGSVPEPGSVALLLMGIVGLVAVACCRRKN